MTSTTTARRTPLTWAGVLGAGALEALLLVAGTWGVLLLAPELLINSWNSPTGMNGQNAMVGGLLLLAYPAAFFAGGLLLRAVGRRSPFVAATIVFFALIPVLILVSVLVTTAIQSSPSTVAGTVTTAIVGALVGALVSWWIDHRMNRPERERPGPPLPRP